MVKDEINTINLYKTYQMNAIQVKALACINITIKKGDYVSIVGSSGSGKSTLLHLIGCLDQPSSGDLFIEDVNIAKLTDDDLARIRREKIGFIFQKFNLIPTLNALENVELAMRFSNIKKSYREQKAKELLELVGLGNRLYHKPSELSGGEQQRVAIARALSNNPTIILGDEPTGNLDTKSGQNIMKVLEEINAQGKTVIIVTHDPLIAKRTRRIFTIKDGVISENYAQ